MANEPTEVDPFLAAIEAKIAALQQLADSYRAVLATGVGFGSTPLVLADIGTQQPAPKRTLSEADLPKNAFRGMGIAQAIRAYLDVVKRKQTVKEITQALQNGGVVSTSENFEKMIGTTLHRLKNDGELLQFQDGWDLAAGYPESFRQRLSRKADEAD